jgi:hypothetical protein
MFKEKSIPEKKKDPQVTGHVTVNKTTSTQTYTNYSVDSYCCEKLKDAMTLHPNSMYGTSISHYQGNFSFGFRGEYMRFCPFCGARLPESN